MNTQSLSRELALFWQKLSYLLGQAWSLLRQLTEDPASIPAFDLVIMAAAALVVLLFLVGGLIRFFSEPWKKKLESLLVLLLTLLILAVFLFFLLRGFPLAEG